MWNVWWCNRCKQKLTINLMGLRYKIFNGFIPQKYSSRVTRQPFRNIFNKKYIKIVDIFRKMG